MPCDSGTVHHVPTLYIAGGGGRDATQGQGPCLCRTSMSWGGKYSAHFFLTRIQLSKGHLRDEKTTGSLCPWGLGLVPL
jgi:hypothetical protein